MKFYLKMALRNLLRHPLRTTLTTVVIVAGIGVLILGEGFVAGVEENIIASAIDGTTSHLTARPKDYPEEGLQHPADVFVRVTPEMEAFFDEHAVAWTARTYFVPTAVAGQHHTRVKAIGYDPETDPKVFPRDLWRIEGREPAAVGNDILVSPGVAQQLKVSQGDSMVLQVRTRQGAINALQVQVAGIVSTAQTTIDFGAILVPKALAARLINAEDPSHVSMRTRSRGRALELEPQFATAVGAQGEIISWDSETKDLIRLQQIRRKSVNFLVFILMALAAFGIANTVLMAAYERIREIGTLRAMGMNGSGVVWLFLVEGALMGVVGSLGGALWGGGMAWYWSRFPIDFSEAAQNTGGGLQFTTLIYTSFSPTFVAGAMVFGAVVAALASIYPARVASKMLPADAVRA